MYFRNELNTCGQRSNVTGRIPWSRVLVEGVVIVFSILLAFAIDAWWAGVGERKQEQLALTGLEADFAGYLVALARVREKNQQRVKSARTLVNLSGPDPGEIDETGVKDLLGQVIVYSSIILPAGTLSSLLETDRLALISDSTLRLELVAWTRTLEVAEERNAYLVEESRALDAFLKPRYPMAQVLRRAQVTVQGLTIEDPMSGSAFPVDVASLLADQEFANHIAFAEDASLLVIQSIEQLEVQAKRILSLTRRISTGGSG
jgi:hypothetical protein